MSIAGVRNSAKREAAQRIAQQKRDAKHAATNPDGWDVCSCEHYRSEHIEGDGSCEVIVIGYDSRERTCPCRTFRFMWKRRTSVSIAKNRAADGDAVEQVLKANDITCNCGHGSECGNQAGVITRDDLGGVWTLCEDCFQKCT